MYTAVYTGSPRPEPVWLIELGHATWDSGNALTETHVAELGRTRDPLHGVTIHDCAFFSGFGGAFLAAVTREGSALRHITSLHLLDCPFDLDRGFVERDVKHLCAALAILGDLEEFSITNSNMDDAACAALIDVLANNLPNLKYLDVGMNYGSLGHNKVAFASALSAQPRHFTTLRLGCTGLRTKALNRVLASPALDTLTELDLSDMNASVVDLMTTHTELFARLHTLHVSGTKLPHRCGETLLRACGSIKKLIAHGARISEEDQRVLCDGGVSVVVTAPDDWRIQSYRR